MYKKFLSIIITLTIIFPIQYNNVFAEEICQIKKESNDKSFVICIDPGHQIKGDSKGEPVAPGSSNKKARVSAGTAGVATKKPEHVVNLEAAMILKEILIDNGNEVIMTREVPEVNISNIERAEVANNSNSDLAIRIHCDSINNESKTGAVILVPSKSNKCTTSIYEKSNCFANILKDKLKSNGIKVNGVIEREDITGFNWSKVPVVILEMGFMSNYNEDKMLSNPEYQRKLMTCVSEAVEEYKLSVS